FGNREPRLRATDRQHHRRGSLLAAQAGRAGERSLPGKTMNYSLQGKAAIVTGAAGGIGGAIAKAFKDAGAQVACVDLAVDKIGRDYLPIRCDVSSEPETK